MLWRNTTARTGEKDDVQCLQEPCRISVGAWKGQEWPLAAQACISIAGSLSHPTPCRRERPGSSQQWSWVGTWAKYHCNFKPLLWLSYSRHDLRTEGHLWIPFSLNTGCGEEQTSIRYHRYYPQRTKGRSRNEWQGCASFAPVKLCTSYGMTYRMTAQEKQGQAIYTGQSSDLLWALQNMEMCLPGFLQCNFYLWGSTLHAETPRCVLSTKWKRQSRPKTGDRGSSATSYMERNTHVCVLEIKTVCLSPDATAARWSAVMTITINGILCGIFLMKDAGKLTTHLEMTVSTCSATLPGRREWQPDNKADLQNHLEG